MARGATIALMNRHMHRGPGARGGIEFAGMLVLLAVAASLLSGCSSGFPGGGRLNAAERMMWSTYPLASGKGMGTGFVVACRDAGSGETIPVVVTSVHVLSTVGKGPLMLGARVPDELGEAEVAVLQFQPRKGRAPFYVRHAHQDVAAFPLELPEAFAELISLPTFLEEKAISPRPRALRTGTEVSFVGFPDVLPGTAGAFPILRTGRIASYPPDATAADGLFLVNSDVYPGDSGAPVFAAGAGGRPELVGMIIRRVATRDRDFSHLAIAVNANAIRETLQLVREREGGTAAVSRASSRQSGSARGSSVRPPRVR